VTWAARCSPRSASGARKTGTAHPGRQQRPAWPLCTWPRWAARIPCQAHRRVALGLRGHGRDRGRRWTSEPHGHPL